MKKILSILVAFFIIGGSLAFYNAIDTYPVDPISTLKKESSLVEDVKVVPTQAVQNKWVDEQIDSMTLREKIGQFFMVAAYSGKDESHFQLIDKHVTEDKVGGIIFFQGDRENLKTAIDRFQSKATIPLLVGMDAEWGTAMRLDGEDRYPYNYTLGAANDTSLSRLTAEMMGADCRELGIHINFAPVADVNSNPDNPVIGFRSFGENPRSVAANVVAQVKGMESQGVMTSIKHFPGHGDTDVDSHLDLPLVNNSIEHINAIDFFPFRSGIRAGASSVMIGHLNVPALDPTGTPSSLSKPTIQKYLKAGMGFEGLVISDALGMKAVANRYGKSEVVVKAFEAGCDILLFPESISDAINLIESKVKAGEIDEVELTNRCRKVLKTKYDHIIKKNELKTFNDEERIKLRKEVYRKAITVLKNDSVFPIQDFSKRIAVVNIGSSKGEINSVLKSVGNMDYYDFKTGDDATTTLQNKLSGYQMVMTNIYCSTVLTKNNFGLPRGTERFLNLIKPAQQSIVSLMGNPLIFKDKLNIDSFDAVLTVYENHPIAIQQMGNVLIGLQEANGQLPISLNLDRRSGFGIEIESARRLIYGSLEDVGMKSESLNGIETIVSKAIAAKAFPGCQVLVAKDGVIVYEKSFGHHTYDKKLAVQNSDLYDIASITKIAASTLSVMYLESNGKFKLENKLQDYLAELTYGTPYATMNIKYMMAHQAGLHPWIPFYTKTLTNGELDTNYYRTEESERFNFKVAEGLYSRSDYVDSMYQQILNKPLKSKTYKYSDLGYYFLKKIVEKESGMRLDQFVSSTFYKPMGLQTIRYNPYKTIPMDRLVPTEDDKIFRKRLIQGYVHDQGASMMDGVGGHAGLFSNAKDLAEIMQLFLNKGYYGGKQYVKPEVIEKFTKQQFVPNNRRGAGFDKPTTNGKGGPSSNLASNESFGHTGFTGTIVWSDPKYNLTYVFLSNRVYPDAENWKIISMNVRTDIQDLIYRAIQ